MTCRSRTVCSASLPLQTVNNFDYAVDFHTFVAFFCFHVIICDATPRHTAPKRSHAVIKGAVLHTQYRVNLTGRGITYCLCCWSITGPAFWDRVPKKRQLQWLFRVKALCLRGRWHPFAIYRCITLRFSEAGHKTRESFRDHLERPWRNNRGQRDAASQTNTTGEDRRWRRRNPSAARVSGPVGSEA